MFKIIKVVLLISCFFSLFGCSNEAENTAQPQEITDTTADAIDGMILKDYPGPKGQIHYNTGDPEFYCDTVVLMHQYLSQDINRKVTGIFVQDMSKTTWDNPTGHWIDATKAFFVQGSKLKGAMGDTLATFSDEAEANDFISKNGGHLLKFSDIKENEVSIDGGVIRDPSM